MFMTKSSGIKLGVCAIPLAAVLVAGGDVSGAASAAAFRGMDPSNDVPYIGYNSYYLWNADTYYFRDVIADLGVSSATSMTVHVRGNTQGYNTNGSYTACSINARGLNNAASVQGATAGTAQLPEGFYTMTVSISGLAAGQLYAFELSCALGHLVPGHAGEQIWAWY